MLAPVNAKNIKSRTPIGSLIYFKVPTLEHPTCILEHTAVQLHAERLQL